MKLKTYSEFVNESVRAMTGNTYTVYLVDYSKRKPGDFSKRYYTDHPVIFKGNKEDYVNFMDKKYPKAQYISVINYSIAQGIRIIIQLSSI